MDTRPDPLSCAAPARRARRLPRPAAPAAIRLRPLRGIMPVLLAWSLGGRLAVSAFSATSPAFTLLPSVQVTSRGVFLSQIVASNAAAILPEVRVGDAPVFRHALFVTRHDIQAALQKDHPLLGSQVTNWAGPERVHVSRRFRPMDGQEVVAALTDLLQREFVQDSGKLELDLTRPWLPIPVPDEPLAWQVRDLPATGVNAFFITRFEVTAGEETVGVWQLPLQAKVWRDVWVARSGVRRGTSLTEADIAQERRDVLSLREPPLSLRALDPRLELAENIVAGGPLYERSVRLSPVMRRGQMVEAQLLDGVIQITLKVELLEDGAPGQLVRVRNVQTKREFRGKVQDANTVQVLL